MTDASEPRSDEPRDLDVVQRWFQAVITHPDGVEEGVASDAAQQIIHMKRDELESVVLRSKNLTAEQRMHVYANAYYARLLECLRESFPMLVRAVGADTFDQFSFGYLQKYPSRSYTLDKLADHFPQYLAETRPDLDEAGNPPEQPDWPDFLIDLATLELAIAGVFDGPGVEKVELVTSEKLQRIAPHDWVNVRFELVPCLILLKFRYPVNAWYTDVRRPAEDEHVPIPAPGVEYMALTRRNYIVRRLPLSEPRYVLLATLQAGGTVGQAIERAGEVYEGSDDQLAADLQRWFAAWAGEQVFKSLIDPD